MATHANSTAVSRAAVMKSAWATYRREWRPGTLQRALFAQCLRAAWKFERTRAEWAAEQANPKPFVRPAEPVLSPLEAALDGLKYLPAHMSYDRAAAQVRARFAAGAR